MLLLFIFSLVSSHLIGRHLNAQSTAPRQLLNGKPCIPTSVDIVVVIDGSGSVEDVFNAYKRLTLDILDQINFDKTSANQMALIQYSRFSTVKYSFNQNQSNEDIYEAADNLVFLGDTTRTADAVYLAIDELKKGRDGVPKVFVLMTDGNSFDAWDSTLSASGKLEKVNATKLIVALGTSVYEPEIKLYGKNGTVFKSGDSKDFKNLMANITGNCFPPPRTTKPPSLPKIDCPIKSKIDIVMVIDSSGSVDSVFNAYKLLAIELVKKIPFSQDGARLSLIQYSRAPAYLKHKFTDPQDNINIFKVINSLVFLGDTTNTADAVSLGYQQFVNARSDAQKVFVLMTDGNSFDPWNVVTQTSDSLHKTKAKVYLVAFGDIIYQPEIKLYAKNGTVIRNSDARSFENELFDLFCPKLSSANKPEDGAAATQQPAVTSADVTPASNPAAAIAAPAPAAPAPAAAQIPEVSLPIVAPSPALPLPTASPIPPAITASLNLLLSTVPPVVLQVASLSPQLILSGSEKPVLKASTQIPLKAFSSTSGSLIPVDIVESAVATSKLPSTLIPEDSSTSNQSTSSSVQPGNISTLNSNDNNNATFRAENVDIFSTNSTTPFSSVASSLLPETGTTNLSPLNNSTKSFEAEVVLAGSPQPVAELSNQTTAAPPAELVPAPTLANGTAVTPSSSDSNNSSILSTETVEEFSSTKVTKKPSLVATNGGSLRQKKSEESNSIIESPQESNAIEIQVQPKEIPTLNSEKLTKKLPIISPLPPAATEVPPLEVETQKTIRITQPPVPKACAADIFFILDSSGSVLRDFQKQISFMQGVIDRLVIDPSSHQVALLEYSGATRQRLQFSFNVYPEKEDLRNAVNGLPFFSGTTSTGEALVVAKRALADRRRGVPLFIFVITDGFSQDDASVAAASIRSEPNSQLYAIGVSEPIERDELLKIGGDEKHVFISIDPLETASKAAAKIPACSGVRFRTS